MPNRPKIAAEVRTNDKIVYKAQGWLVLDYEALRPKLGAPIAKLTLRNMSNGEVEILTFAADQEMVVY